MVGDCPHRSTRVPALGIHGVPWRRRTSAANWPPSEPGQESSVAVGRRGLLPRDGRRLARRAGRRAVAVIVVALAALVTTAGPAAAHPTLLTTVPAAGYTGDGPVRQAVLAFDEPVTATADAISVTTASGHHEPTGPLQRQAGGRQLVLPLVAPQTAGQFRVHWQVTAQDGDVVDGTFAFGIGAPSPATPGSGDAGSLGGTAALRWLLFAALAVAAGGLVGERLVAGRAGPADGPVLLAPLRSAAAAGMVAAVGLTGLVAHSAGGWSAIPHLRALELTAAEAAAFALTLALAAVSRLRRFAIGPLAVVVLAEGLRAHPEAYQPGWGAALTVVHLAAAAVWVGALIHVVRAAHRFRRQNLPGRGRELVRAYARCALVLFLLVISTGTIASLLVLRTPTDLVTTGYGQVLAGKLVLVAVISVLALIGRSRVRRKASAATPELGRATRFERSVLVAVLGVTALLVSLPAPQPVATALTLPPPPVGPTTGFGTLLGQISLGATASAGQLQLQLSTPGGDPGEPGTADPHVAVTLDAPGGRRVGVPLRRCGSGCFLAGAPWRNGTDQVSVTASAAGWHGGTGSFSVSWPPVDASGRLHSVVAALRATGAVVLTEADTSDTTGPTYVAQLHLTGDRFLDSEPYGNGGAPIVTALPPQAGAARLAVAYPVNGVYLTLTLDRHNRPVSEVEATPNHLITRTFRYPTD